MKGGKPTPGAATVGERHGADIAANRPRPPTVAAPVMPGGPADGG